MELGSQLQGLDYTYLLDGSLKAINNSDKTKDPGSDGTNGFLADAFGMVLDYYANDYRNTRTGIKLPKGVNTGSYGTDSYNGQIKAMTWFSQKPASVTGLDAPTTNVFKYDNRYRFIENTWGTGLNFNNTPASFTATTYNKETIKDPVTATNPGYDSHGNILYLQRTNTAGQLVDKFQYNYKANSNQLASVANSATGTSHPYASYTYDSLGQLIVENTADTSRKKYLRYDVTGKLILVARDAAFTRKVAEFTYDENGARICKKSYNAAGQLIATTWYIDGVIYTKTGTGSIVAAEYAIDGGSGRIGTYYKSGNVYAYELRDQLGNVRAVIAKSGSSLEVRGYSDYYPYGMVLRSGGTNYRYGYQGAYAEKDGETDWNAFELRMYDSRIARWLTTDPAGQYASPYIGMGGDPVNGVDKDGGTDDCPTCPPLPTVTVYAYRNISNVVNISHLDGIPINVVQNQDRLIKVDIPAPPAISQTPQYDNATRARIAQRAWDYNASHGINPNTGQPYVTYSEWGDNASENVVKRMLTIWGVWDGVLAGRDIVMWGAKKLAKGGINAAKTRTSFAEGSFSVFNWKGYPAGGIKPTGPFRLLEGAEYTSARSLANSTNAAMRRANPEMFKGLQIHEIHPVKFGGSPTDLSNKIFLTPSQHAQYTNFWNGLMRSTK